MTSSPSIWIDTAAAHGSTSWVKQFIRNYLPPLAEQSLSIDDFVTAWEDELRSRNLDTPAKQKNYRSNVVQAIKTFSNDHPAIALVALSSQQYRDLNNQQRGKLADRETRYFTSEQAERVVEHATTLLNSAEWSEVGAGLAVLIGRRISEVLLSQFAPKSDWSITFSEMSKKKNTQGLTIEIPTLAPAATVLKAIDRLQKRLRIDDLKLNSRFPKMAKQTVNSRFSSPIASRCVEHFSQLVPSRSDKDNLYTHIFRAVYATIAAHWFCPPYVPEHLFKAEIQGHFSITSDGSKLPNFSARANYDDYAIGTEDGNRDGRLGIKLGKLPNLHIIDAFRKPSPDILIFIDDDGQATNNDDIDKNEEEQNELSPDRSPLPLNSNNLTSSDSPQSLPNSSISSTEITMTSTHNSLTKRTEIFVDDLEEITRFMAKRGVTGKPKDIFHALVQTLDSIQDDYIKYAQAHTQLATEFTANMRWFTDRIDSLEQSFQQLKSENEQLKQNYQHLQQENDTLKNNQTSSNQLSHLEAENQQLKQQLSDTQNRLEGIQKLLGVSLPIATHHQQENEMIESLTTSKQPKPKSNTSPKKNDTLQKIHQIIDAIIAWNTSQELSMNRLRISIPIIKVLANAIGANYQPAIQQAMQERGEELDELHNRLMLGTRHNATVRKEQILEKIQKQYLAVSSQGNE